MKKITFILCIFAWCTAAFSQQLPQDSTIRKGVLANGMTYYVRHNAQTPNVAEFYIAQRVGSILEEPRQRGLAHFLEHMAFNGTLNFPGDSLRPGIVKWCESVGIKFGANLNAYTSVDETVYNISSAPVKREGVVDSCLLILHDWSHYLLLSDTEIDKERGVIHEEWRTRRASMAVQRLMERAMPVVYAGSKYADCLPIGSMDIVDHFPYQDLKDYYQKWYRPDLQAIIVVGDIDIDRVEQKIKTLFGSIPMPQNAAERIYYPVPDNDKMIVFTATDKEQPTVNFTLYMKRDATPMEQRSTEAYFADEYKTDLVRTMLNDRLTELGKQHNPPFISASVRDGNFFLADTKDAFMASAMFKQDSILSGIAALLGEIERTRKTGFTQAEFDRAKQEQLNMQQSSYNERAKRRNRSFVRQCLNNFLQGEPMLSPDTELALIKKLTDRTTLAELNDFVREMITDRNQVVTLYGPEKGNFRMPSHEAIETAILRAQQKTYEPYREKKLPSQLIGRLPKPGKIVSERNFKHGYREMVLSNGMKVYVRPTNFDDDDVNMNIFSAGGKSLYPASSMPDLTYLISGATTGGVGEFDELTLEKMLAGKTVSVSPFIGDETEGIKGSSNVKDMKTMFELTYLYFTAPRRDTTAFRNLMTRQSEFLTNRDANPSVTYNDSLSAIVYGHHPRMLPMTKERLSQVDYDRIMKIYRERFGNAADFSVILTGNIDLKALRPLVCQYLASLPATGKRETVHDTGANIIDANEVHRFVKTQDTPSSMTTIILTGRIPYTAKNDLRLDALCQLLRIAYTEKVREEQGGTYGVSVRGDLQRYPYSEAMVKIAFRTDPDKYSKLIPIIYDELKAMAEKGPDANDLAKVKEYELKTYGQVQIMNNYWEQVIYNELFNGIDLDTTFKADVEALTTESIRDLAKQIFDQHRRIEITMSSKPLKTD